MEWLAAEVMFMTFSFLVVTNTLIFILSDEVPHAEVVRK